MSGSAVCQWRASFQPALGLNRFGPFAQIQRKHRLPHGLNGTGPMTKQPDEGFPGLSLVNNWRRYQSPRIACLPTVRSEPVKWGPLQ